MVVINVAYTAPINPPGTLPALTPAQVWAGLQAKVRHAEKFVPIITSCAVLSEQDDADTGHVITRAVTFRPGAAGPGGRTGGEAKEVCRLFAPCRVDFVQEDGTTIGNYVSEGAEGELYMTYVFQWKVPGVGEGSEEARGLGERYKQVRFSFSVLFLVLSCSVVCSADATGVGGGDRRPRLLLRGPLRQSGRLLRGRSRLPEGWRVLGPPWWPG